MYMCIMHIIDYVTQLSLYFSFRHWSRWLLFQCTLKMHHLFRLIKKFLNGTICVRLGYEKVAELLIRSGIDVNIVGQDRNTALIVSANKGSFCIFFASIIICWEIFNDTCCINWTSPVRRIWEYCTETHRKRCRRESYEQVWGFGRCCGRSSR